MLENDATNSPHKMAKEIDLKEIFAILRRQIWIGISLTVILAGIGLWYSKTHKPVPLYGATTRLLISGSNDMSTFIVMFTDPTVLTKVSSQLGSKRSPANLSNEITINNLNSSQVVSIQVTDRDPNLAAQIANTEATVFKSEVAKVLNFKKVSQLQQAQVNPNPINSSSSKKPMIYLGIAGLILGIFIGFLRNSFDDSVRTEKDLERLLALPVVGSISVMTHKNSRKFKGKRLRLLQFLLGESKKHSQKAKEHSEKENAQSKTNYRDFPKAHHD